MSRKPSAILCADLHLMEKIPVCRPDDDIIQTQINKLSFIKNLCEEHKAPLLIAGDIFDYHRPSPFLISIALNYLPASITIPGQHDLPQHSLDLYHKSGLSALESAGLVAVLKDVDGTIYRPEKDFGNRHSDWLIKGYPFGTEPKPLKRKYQDRKTIAMIHQLVTHKDKLFPDSNAPTARKLLGELSGFDLILSGDNHQNFDLTHRGRTLVNPGSVLRSTTKQIDHKPAVYLWFAENNSIEKVLLPIEENIITQVHIEQEKEQDKRIDDYIERMEVGYDKVLNFKENLKTHISINNVKKDVANEIWEATEGKDND